MTILPKKKPQPGNGQTEQAESSEKTQPVPQISQPLQSHIQPGEGTSRGTLYLPTQSPPPCWAPSSTTNNTAREEKWQNHGASSPYEENLENSSHGKRRYRASPISTHMEGRAIRPKIRDYRGSGSPPYPSTSSAWNAVPHPHSLQIPSPSMPALPASLSPQAGPSGKRDGEEDSCSGYNSGDEYEPYAWNLTKEKWEEKERWFEKKMKKKGLIIKKMQEDGACLFRAIADQIYGDQEMHSQIRKYCMEYVAANEDAFAPFVSENFRTYVQRKRRDDCFGNHIEIAAMSEMYNRIIEVYCYSVEPINIFQGTLQTDNEPIRLSYHRGSHYNSLVDPYKATIGVGLGLPGMQPGIAEKNLMLEATKDSENFHIEQAMLEDKIRATDFEATVEAIEKQVSQESLMQWLCDNERRKKAQHSPSSVGGSSRCRSSPLHETPSEKHPSSPRISPSPQDSNVRHSPRLASSTSCDLRSLPEYPAVPGTSKDPVPGVEDASSSFILNENASFLNQLPPDVFDPSEYSEDAVLARVLALSQQEFLDSLRSHKEDSNDSLS